MNRAFSFEFRRRQQQQSFNSYIDLFLDGSRLGAAHGWGSAVGGDTGGVRECMVTSS